MTPTDLEAIAHRVESPEWENDTMLENHLGHVFHRAGSLRSVDIALSLLPPSERLCMYWTDEDDCTVYIYGTPTIRAESSGDNAIPRAIVAAALRLKARE